jgi:hypothetical protein
VPASASSGVSEDIPAGQLGSSAEELTATTTFQSGVNGVVDDTFISASDMRANVGNDKRLRISAHNEGLIRFDLSSIPANAVINKAELTLYVNGGEDERDDDCRDGDHEGNSIAPLKVHRVTAAWAEGTVTYKSFDQAFDPAVAATMTLSSRHTYKTVDLKPLVQSWVSGSKPNYGVAITTAGRAHTLIASSEQNPVSQRPALKITYTTPDDHCSPNRCQHGGTLQQRQQRLHLHVSGGLRRPRLSDRRQRVRRQPVPARRPVHRPGQRLHLHLWRRLGRRQLRERHRRVRGRPVPERRCLHRGRAAVVRRPRPAPPRPHLRLSPRSPRSPR